MIEKLDPEVSAFYTSLDLVNKINEVIDYLNKQQELVEEVKPDSPLNWIGENKAAQPAPKVGDLCYFWDDEKELPVLSELSAVDKTSYLIRRKDYTYIYYCCQLAEIDGKPNYPEHIKKLIK